MSKSWGGVMSDICNKMAGEIDRSSSKIPEVGRIEIKSQKRIKSYYFTITCSGYLTRIETHLNV